MNFRKIIDKNLDIIDFFRDFLMIKLLFFIFLFRIFIILNYDYEKIDICIFDTIGHWMSKAG